MLLGGERPTPKTRPHNRQRRVNMNGQEVAAVVDIKQATLTAVISFQIC